MLSSKNLFDDLSIASYTLTFMVYLESDLVLKPRIMGFTKITNFRFCLAMQSIARLVFDKLILSSLGTINEFDLF